MPDSLSAAEMTRTRALLQRAAAAGPFGRHDLSEAEPPARSRAVLARVQNCVLPRRLGFLEGDEVLLEVSASGGRLLELADAGGTLSLRNPEAVNSTAVVDRISDALAKAGSIRVVMQPESISAAGQAGGLAATALLAMTGADGGLRALDRLAALFARELLAQFETGELRAIFAEDMDPSEDIQDWVREKCATARQSEGLTLLRHATQTDLILVIEASQGGTEALLFHPARLSDFLADWRGNARPL